MLAPLVLVSVPILGTCVMVLVATKVKRLFLAMIINALIGTIIIPIGGRGWGLLGLAGNQAFFVSIGSSLLTAIILWHVRKRHPHWFQ